MVSRKDLDLITRMLDGELSQAEQRRVDALLAVSGEARAEQQRIRDVRRLVKASARTDDRFDDSFVDDTLARLRRDDPPTRFKSTPPIYRVASARTLRYAVAACTALVVVALAILLMVGRSNGPEQLPVRIVDLADGSRVSLAVGASLDLPDDFSEGRRVGLIGEAFFEVETTGDPFIVDVDHGEIVVTGTSFNVRAWDDGPDHAEVTLVEGSIEVRGQSGTPVRLVPGQRLRFGESGVAAPSVVDIPHVVAWRTRGFGFQHETLDVVFAEVARRFGTEVSLSADVDVTRRLTYLSPRPGSLTSVLSDLCHAVNLRFRQTRAGYEIHAP